MTQTSAPATPAPPVAAAVLEPAVQPVVNRAVEPTPSTTVGAPDAAAPPVLTVNDLPPAPPADACPPHMRYIRGGEFWMGSPRGRGAQEERPRFLTKVADYCLETHEVTAAEYAECVARGACTAPHGSQSTCNYDRRADHPINCIDWQQAREYCESEGSRLPSELEWEYAARGGDQYQSYSWGEESPDGRACWKNNHSCPVGSFEPGAFGLHDMSGNVWEWTNDWFSDYPWPKPTGLHKVFRGGGWSRRFDKWMRATLRNRTNPESWGSHLGFRCARLAKNAECPFGADAEPGLCRHGVIAAECQDPQQSWNGLRCAGPGEPECRPGSAVTPGHGCVATGGAPARRARSAADATAAAVARTRSPEFDEDCRQNQPKRPNAYLVQGGSHLDRNRYGNELGCKNRDVGVGWNSACCP